MKIERIRIRDFKTIDDITLELDNANLLIGGNNAGKSSVIQGIHFAISALRSARLHGKGVNQPATTLGLNQFSFLPTNEVMKINYRTSMTQDYGPDFEFTYLDEEGNEESFSLFLYRGKNANISLRYNKISKFFSKASDLSSPFSVFVPGLAGLPLIEERRANSIVQTGIAQGDANLFLRNVLLRLSTNAEKLRAFHELMQGIFPGFKTRTTFNENINQYINSEVCLNGFWAPLEMAGTGCLQALQVAAYVILYEPKLLLLDEPDAHLHPGNQKLLVDLLFTLSESTGTQIILASHSRHVFDSVSNNALGAIHWLEDGDVIEDDRADVALLMDLGALDNFSKLVSEDSKVLVFAEDEKTKKLRIILEANGWALDNIEFVSFNGVDNLDATKVVVEYFLGLGEDRKALIYRDGDCMTDDEKTWLREKYTNELPENATLYISPYTDVEHFFCVPGHVAHVAQMPEEEAFAIVSEVVGENQAILGAKLARKRNDLKFKSLRNCPNRASTDDLVEDGIGFDMSLGKLLSPKIMAKLHENGYPVGELTVPSAALESDILKQFIEQ
ncbi:AAA family ATPase [Enterovirga sp. GCM10030262]|uniref:AAA family ATPase n=1 Tax=Enterovirga sp. GCM10030262 TaxID=3273391 RepID=UPI0036209373